LLLPSDASFWELHLAIQDSFGWTGYHLHQFFIGPIWDRNTLRICLSNLEENILEEKKEPLDESKTTLSDYLSKKRPRISYIYDFGDDWDHQIILEKELPFNGGKKYPQVIAGKRACPWEDSGGPWGYQEKIEILKNKKRKYYKEVAEWVGINDFSELDLESFDPKEVIFGNPKTELRRYKEMVGLTNPPQQDINKP